MPSLAVLICTEYFDIIGNSIRLSSHQAWQHRLRGVLISVRQEQ